MDAIYTLFYEQRDLLLLAKTGFGKSLIFQLVPFFFDPKYRSRHHPHASQASPSQTKFDDNNRISSGKAIALTRGRLSTASN